MTRKYFLLISFLLLSILHSYAQEQQYTRIKGYYRVYQATNSMLTYFVDGMMEFYIPLNPKEKKHIFIDRKFLGERRRKAPLANGDDIFVRMCLPSLEQRLLIESINSEEYSTRNNGDVYRWADKCGKISTDKVKIGKQIRSTKTIEMDELMGQPNHELDLSQMKMYGIVARMTRYDDSETYLSEYLPQGSDTLYTMCPILSAQKHQTFMAHYRGDDVDDRIDVWCDFYVTDRIIIDEAEKKRVNKEKNKIYTFAIPDTVPPVEKEIEEAWRKMIEY